MGAWHGGHHVAQKSSKRTWPCSCLMSAFPSSRTLLAPVITPILSPTPYLAVILTCTPYKPAVAALILFEQEDQFHQLFHEQCLKQNLPEEFYRPILLHSSINDEGHHQDVGGHIFDLLPYISWEDQQLVKRNMISLLEIFIARSQEIVEYYGNPHNIIPRCF